MKKHKYKSKILKLEEDIGNRDRIIIQQSNTNKKLLEENRKLETSYNNIQKTINLELSKLNISEKK